MTGVIAEIENEPCKWLFDLMAESISAEAPSVPPTYVVERPRCRPAPCPLDED